MTSVSSPAADSVAGRGDLAATSWWSRRFIAVLESFGLGPRLERGRDYAHGGQVTELEVEPGIVLARVRGTRLTPYRVRIRAKLFSDYQWRRAERALAAQARPLAELLAGRMPHDIEELLATCRLTLFPASYQDVKASCSCPDGENPCKHIAAVYYLLAERFDADPLAIFTWRGRPEEELLEGLRARRAGRGGRARSATERQPEDAVEPDDFWSVGRGLAGVRIEPLAGEAPDALVRRLGPAPTKSGGREVGEALADLYLRLAVAAERRALA